MVIRGKTKIAMKKNYDALLKQAGETGEGARGSTMKLSR